ncbi:hypothetical protein AAHB58_25765 [Enterobacter hormaechei]
MKKQILAAAALVASLALSGCGDDGIYGTYENAQYGAVLDVQKDVIKFRGESFPVKSWDETKSPYTSPELNIALSGHGRSSLRRPKTAALSIKAQSLKRINQNGK